MFHLDTLDYPSMDFLSKTIFSSGQTLPLTVGDAFLDSGVFAVWGSESGISPYVRFVVEYEQPDHALGIVVFFCASVITGDQVLTRWMYMFPPMIHSVRK